MLGEELAVDVGDLVHERDVGVPRSTGGSTLARRGNARGLLDARAHERVGRVEPGDADATSSSDSRRVGSKPGTSAPSPPRTRRPCAPSGPAWSKLGASGKQPSSGTSPYVGLKPTTPHHAAGIRIEPPESVPSATSASPAASAAPLPPLDPPASRPGATGFGTVPKCGFCDEIPYANSCRFVLPTFAYPARLEPA